MEDVVILFWWMLTWTVVTPPHDVCACRRDVLSSSATVREAYTSGGELYLTAIRLIIVIDVNKDLL